VADVFSPPAPVAVAEHGVCGAPVKGAPRPHVTTVVDEAFAMLKLAEPALASWLASPVKLALAVAVPALVWLA
jgi:hypothetical protein